MRSAIISIVALAVTAIATPARIYQIGDGQIQAPTYGWSSTAAPVPSSTPVAPVSTSSSSSTSCAPTPPPYSAPASSTSSSVPASSSTPVAPVSTSASSAAPSPPAPPPYSVPGNSTTWASTAAPIGTTPLPRTTVSPVISSSVVSPVSTSSSPPIAPPTNGGVVVGAEMGVTGAVLAGLFVLLV